LQEATVDDWVSQADVEETASDFDRLWMEQRGHAAEILASQKARLDEIELRFAAQLELIGSEIPASLAEGPPGQDTELQRQRAELEAQRSKFEREQGETCAELQQWSDQLRRKQEELERRAEEVEQQSRKVAQLERGLQQAREDHDADTTQLSHGRSRFEERQKRLDVELEELEADRAKIKEKRRQIAEHLKQHRAKLRQEIERRKAELEAAHQAEFDRLRRECEQSNAERESLRNNNEALTAQLADQSQSAETARGELVQVTAELHAAQQTARDLQQKLQAECAGREEIERQLAAKADPAVEQQEFNRLREERDELTRQLDATRQELQAACEQAAQNTSVDQQLRQERDELLRQFEAAREELAEMRREASQNSSIAAQQADAERAELTEQCQNAQRQTAEQAQRIAELERLLADAEARADAVASKADNSNDDEVADLQRRFELAVEDVRALKRRNAELEDQVIALKTAGKQASPAVDATDWEAMKRRMLAELEADGEPSAEQKEERTSIENTIRITDDVVAQKDREIQELKEVLNQQSDNLGSVAVGAAAVEDLFNSDELIRQERERLQQAENEWREKLRQAEVEISLERARLARQRVELDEKFRGLESERAKMTSAGNGQPNDKNAKSGRGRWLERLGLKDSDS
jgi:chromosome segregation ATPase